MCAVESDQKSRMRARARENSRVQEFKQSNIHTNTQTHKHTHTLSLPHRQTACGWKPTECRSCERTDVRSEAGPTSTRWALSRTSTQSCRCTASSRLARYPSCSTPTEPQRLCRPWILMTMRHLQAKVLKSHLHAGSLVWKRTARTVKRG
jgi:hypothetical protein